MNIKSKIRQHISDSILYSDNGYQFADEDSFLEHGILDSMGVMELVYFVEESFGIKVANHDLTPDNFDSVELLAAYISRTTESGAG